MDFLGNFRENRKKLNWGLIKLFLCLFILLHLCDAVFTYHIVCNLGGIELVKTVTEYAYRFGFVPMLFISTIYPLFLFFLTLIFFMLLTQKRTVIYLVLFGGFVLTTLLVVIYEIDLYAGFARGVYQWVEYPYFNRALFCRLF